MKEMNALVFAAFLPVCWRYVDWALPLWAIPPLTASIFFDCRLIE
jgi:hypothetical protein